MSGTTQQSERRDINKVELRGTLGRDAESRTTQGGHRFVGLSIATSEKWKDRQGAWQEKTEWHRATVAFNDELADLAVDELTEITGQTPDEAKALILKAREHWFSSAASE